ncbi:MAG TPA: DUF3077 domain-containing protein [Pseudomonas sp.]|jgi:hypothetical protein|uniref:DUF3077 domain-containing protein n=2 Tax=Pseudomonas helleri TaxID=1608996 RepID=A0A0J6HZD3_9PSED|nr:MULTISPECIES: hypothetical protein [Pseudomonas]KMN00907.1 hypothetical protein TU84_22475 [Pseudomonas helleri]MQT40111.1 DUF3077 domain-containing protein [Pseudomonas sp. FSL R10-0765]MQT51191.1 DUF3077 domain-containing protein [Pseudomonas sp. FSL R10-2398]MQU02338.1 DUF3077 domain-containing protein [Pseudomonas sp. FSL R10-2245]MQU07060.1 DUF3077 domain-containing protein [Pseudomonas helleri]
MTSITKITPETELDIELEALKDDAATQRALDYYLKPAVSQPPQEKKVFVVSDDVSQEEAMVTACEYLRCGVSMVHSAADTHQGAHRDQFLALAFFIESAKQLLDKALDVQKLTNR